MPTHWARACTRAANVAAQHEPIQQHLNRGYRVLVLRNTHAPAGNDPLGLAVHLCGSANLHSRQTALLLQQNPRFSSQVSEQGIKTNRMPSNERLVQNLLAVVLQLNKMLHHAFDKGEIATNTKLKIMRADRGAAQRCHLQHVLRISKALQPTFAQRVDADDARAPTSCLTQFTQHARMVGTRVLPEDKNRIGFLKIIQGDRAFAAADALNHAHAAGLMAHVGAVGEVVGAVFTHKQLVQKRSLVAGPS